MHGMSLCIYLWIAWFAIWIVWAIGTKKTQQREKVSSRLSYVVLSVVAFLLMFSEMPPQDGWLRMPVFPASTWTERLGIIITAAGLGFAIWARAYLGTNWSGIVTVKVGHELVRSGPYRWVRHPIYSGMILAMLGTAVEFRQVRGFIAVVMLYAAFKIKSRIEERTMTATFGPAYAEYMSTTGAIVPRLRW